MFALVQCAICCAFKPAYAPTPSPTNEHTIATAATSLPSRCQKLRWIGGALRTSCSTRSSCSVMSSPLSVEEAIEPDDLGVFLFELLLQEKDAGGVGGA